MAQKKQAKKVASKPKKDEPKCGASVLDPHGNLLRTIELPASLFDGLPDETHRIVIHRS